jgi:hypothetical protein
MEFIVGIIMGIIFSALGAFLIGLAIYSYIKGKQSLKWLRTRGEIIQIDLKNVEYSDSTDHQFILKFKFAINDIEYIGKKVIHMTYESESSKYNKIYYLKKLVDVYYNSKNPEENDLEIGVDYNFILLIFFGFIILVCGIFKLLPSEWLYWLY